MIEEATKPQELEQEESNRNAVKATISRVKKAKSKWADDFKRIRENMDFAAGIQWSGQKRLRYDKYIANLTLKNVNQKVASLYARNPMAEDRRRKRLDFQLYDGHVESLVPILQMASTSPLGLLSLSPEQQALVTDYQQGIHMREMIDRVG